MKWFQEKLNEHHKQMLSVETVHYHWRTLFQDVLIFENATFGKVLVLDGGTTCIQVARHLPLTLSATVVTHSPSIAVELSEQVNIEELMLGGRLFRHSMVGTGAATLEAIGRIRADLYFMGVCSVHSTAGLTTGE